MTTIASIKRDSDFTYNGEYVVTLSSGEVVRIYRNTASGLNDWRTTDDIFLGFTKAEALEKIVASHTPGISVESPIDQSPLQPESKETNMNPEELADQRHHERDMAKINKLINKLNMPQETQVSRMVDGYRLDGLKVADTTGISGYVVIVSIFNAYGTLLDQFEADALMLLELHFAFDYRLTADVERQLSEFWTACVK